MDWLQHPIATNNLLTHDHIAIKSVPCAINICAKRSGNSACGWNLCLTRFCLVDH